MTNAIEGLMRGDGRIALFHGDQFLGHFKGGDFTAAGTNGAAPESNGAAAPGPKRRAKAAPNGAARVKSTDAAPARKGRRPSYTPAQETRVMKLLKKEQSVNAIAQETGLSWHVVNKIRTSHAAELTGDDEGSADNDTDDDPAHRGRRGRSPPARERMKPITLSKRAFPVHDDDDGPIMRFTDAGRVRTEGLDLDAIDQVVAEAVRGGKLPEDPARCRAMELWDSGWRDIQAIADECYVALSTVQYWQGADDWECRRGRQVLKSA